MWILMMEAGVALFLLVFIVWWTMYQGQPRGGREQDAPQGQAKDQVKGEITDQDKDGSAP